jgi:DNA invertase Pin-like site-specific DNA recombinase
LISPFCRENDPFRGSWLIFAKSLILFVLDCRKNLVQKVSMKIGYARVSTEEQNLDLQIEALTEAGCDRIITDQAQSGAKAAESRAGFSEAMELLGEGDLLVVWKLDRVGRSIADLIHLLKLFGDRGIEFRSLTDGIDTTTAGGRLVFHIMGALAEFERDLIQERTKAGLRAARRRGKRLGRPPALSTAQIKHAKTVIETKRETVSGMAEILGVNRSTLQRAMSREFSGGNVNS